MLFLEITIAGSFITALTRGGNSLISISAEKPRGDYQQILKENYYNTGS
jgi:hypothetical protein